MNQFDPSQLDEMLQQQQDSSELLDPEMQGEQYIDPEQVQQAILQNMLDLLERQDLNVDVQAKTALTYAQAYNTLVQALPPEAQFRLEVMKHQHDMHMKEREMALKEQQAQHDMQLKQQELEHRLALQQQKALNAEHDRLLKQEQLSQQAEMQKQQLQQQKKQQTSQRP